MNLEGHFYQLEEIGISAEGVLHAVAAITHEHPIFEGHFPQQAVVPGVCTLTIIRECLSKVLQREVVFCAIKECKYVSALLPFDGLKIVIDVAITDATELKGTVTRQDNGQLILKLKASMQG